MSLNSTRTSVLIDDSDNRVVYSPSGGGSLLWTSAIDPNLLANEWDGTAHVTERVNATARLSFRGSRVKVYGTLDMTGGSSSYLVLGGTPQIVNHPSSSITYSYTFFDSGELPFDNHTLVITNLGLKGHLRLDYFEVMTDNPTGPETALASSTKKGLSGGAVAAIVLSIIGFLIALAVAAWIIWRCRRIKRLRRMSMGKGFEIETGEQDIDCILLLISI
ncbi:hypothetical protein NLI96_g12015 [Meripilus lineatus]|uniref:Uncharacterized protein n=1 Tax=Meripilus lineatus TaxID=2056292 RepID=A0AAD5Y7Y6_9APHY|nr:hypothetical protein NLI96_g12015 [Physisporinus lineatus]